MCVTSGLVPSLLMRDPSELSPSCGGWQGSRQWLRSQSGSPSDDNKHSAPADPQWMGSMCGRNNLLVLEAQILVLFFPTA